MKYMWIPVQEYSNQEIYELTELLKSNHKLELVISAEPPVFGTDKERMKLDIERLLSEIGIGAHLKGWKYLRTAICLGAEDRELLDGITKHLYPEVAKVYETSVGQVEHAIRHAIAVSWNKGSEEALKKIFKYYTRENKWPTNSEFICGMVEYVKGRNVIY